MDYLLRAATESDMDDALISAGLVREITDEDGEVFLLPTEGVSLDRIGPIPARVDEENVIISPGDNRYHVNLRATVQLTAAQVAELPVFTPAPTVPYRVFI